MPRLVRRLLIWVTACSLWGVGLAASSAAAATETAVTVTHATATGNGLARTPPMGFNDWNAFGCDVSEQLIEQTADYFITSGLKAAGYTYLNIDDCWMTHTRDDQGRLVPDPVKFPNGIKGTADYVHSKGLKLGIYEAAGTATCAGYPGSLGHETTDAQSFAEWGVDYLKYDNCNNQSDGSQADYIRRYTTMHDALGATGRPIVLSICEWGTSQPWQWGPGVGSLWRTTGDISDNWPSVRSIIAANAKLAPYSGPGHWNDPDMLEVGNGGMTATEYRTHMSMWAIMAAPLIIGTDLRKASAETLGILTDKDIISIDQDPLGVQGKVVSDDHGLMVLDKPLSNGEHAIALYNSTDTLTKVGVSAHATGLRRSAAYRLQDVWTKDVTQTRSVIEAAVPAHGTVVYKVRSMSDPHRVAPSVNATGEVPTLVPGTSTAGTLATTATNRGAGAVRDVRVSVTGPAGWKVSNSTTGRRPALATDASLTTTWKVQVPDGASAGSYPLHVTASYKWGSGHTSATSSDVFAQVVTAPADGRRYLSTVNPASSTNGLGPVEADQSNGQVDAGDGSLITVAGRVHDRGLGTSTDSEIRYYLGGQCSRLTTDVGIDDEDTSGTSATFTIQTDAATAASTTLAPGAAAQTLTADLTGAQWLVLTTASATADATAHADWASPALTCGNASPTDPIQPTEHTLFSFESGTDGFTVANADSGGTVEQSSAFHTDGEHGLLAHAPTGGNWFGGPLDNPLDLSGVSSIKFDVKAGTTGTSAEIAVQTGDSSWCQASLWTWVTPGSSKTITRRIGQISCPTGVSLEDSPITSVWVFLNSGGDHVVDNIRTE
ncbi:NPCBM/NEW2 domain-containing protein [Streptomyces sp. LN785]|uniref:NPCBM/NEW2 domain-containing protein n=1 Tax=Streptomyces sp. LN785 TaxID=3112983 RepID=UPI00371CEBC6